MALEVSRRRFFGFLAAPAIVHVGNLMPIKALSRGVALRSMAHPYRWIDLANPGLHEVEIGYAIVRQKIDESLYRKMFAPNWNDLPT